MKRTDIDALARLLDGDAPDGDVPKEMRSLSVFAKALESTSRPTATMEHKDDLRASLIAAARTELTAPGFLTRIRASLSDTTARWRYSARLGAATGASALALSSGGVAVAAQQALPDHPLYGVKLLLEDARMAFVGDSLERANLHLTYAERRLEEARISAESGDMDGAARALREADEASREGARHIIQAALDRDNPALLDILAEFSTMQRNRLAALLPLLSGDAARIAGDAIVVLNRIDQRVAVLSGTCLDCAAKEDATRPSGDGARSVATNADLRDFDFADIPAADEPFAACPCADPAADDGEAAEAAEDAEESAEPAREGADDAEDEADTKPDEKPEPADEEPDEDPGPGVPEPVEDVADEVEDEADEAEDVVEDVLDELPDPSQTPGSDTGAVPGPNASAPGVPLP